LKVVLVISGASGVVVGLRLAEVLSKVGEVYTIVTQEGLLVADYECLGRNRFVKLLRSFSKEVYLANEIDAPLASSSFLAEVGIAAPASMRLISSLAQGLQEDLASRALISILRRRGKVIVVFRESPLGVAELKNLLRLAERGVIVIPAVLGFYGVEGNVRSFVDFVVGKVLDVLGVKHDLYSRWTRKTPPLDPCRIFYE